MTFVSGTIRWGATVDEIADTNVSPRHWLVELESDSLGSIVGDTSLSRLATHAEHLTPNAAATCSVTLGRFRVTLKIKACTPNEAADTGEHVFARALETAVWPRSGLARLVEYTVSVKPTDEYAYAA